MKFKEKTKTIAVSENAYKKLKETLKYLKNKTFTNFTFSNLIEEFCNDQIQLTKIRILDEYYTITEQEANEIIKDVDNHVS